MIQHSIDRLYESPTGSEYRNPGATVGFTAAVLPPTRQEIIEACCRAPAVWPRGMFVHPDEADRLRRAGAR